MTLARLLVLLSVLYMIFIGASGYTTNVLPLKIIFHAGVSLVTLGALLKRRALPRTPLDGWLALYLLWLGISAVLAEDTRISLERVWLMGIYVLWLYLLLDMRRERWWFEGLFLGGGVIVLVSALEWLSWYFGLVFVPFPQDWFSLGGLADPIPPTWHGLSLVFGFSTTLGNFLVLLIPTALAWGLTTARRDNRLGLLGLAGALGVTLLLTFSSGALAGVVVALGVLGLFCWLPARAALALTLLGTVSGFALLLPLTAAPVSPVHDDARTSLWEAAVESFQDAPLSGVGPAQFASAYRVHRTSHYDLQRLSTAHNIVLNTSAETGIPGVLILLGVSIGFLRAWWSAYAQVSKAEQTRLVGILAALAGLSVHSAVDVFHHPALGLVLALYGAYVLARTPLLNPFPTRFAVAIRPALALLVAASLAGWLRADWAEVAYRAGLNHLAGEEYAAALEDFQTALDRDPAMRLYGLHLARTQARLGHTDAALATYERYHVPGYDAGWVNRAHLHAMRGDVPAALDALEHAQALRPNDWAYHWLEGDYRLRLGDLPGAEAAFIRALDHHPYLAESAYWLQHDAHEAARRRALDAAYNQAAPADRLRLAISLRDSARADRAAADLSPQTPAEYVALAEYHATREDFQAARAAYAQAADLRGEYRYSWSMAVAELYWREGDTANAEAWAKRGIFTSFGDPARAYYVLARVLDLPDEVLKAYLWRAVPEPLSLMDYSFALFDRPGLLEHDAPLPGRDAAYYAPWFWLAERFPDEAALVDERLRERAPYLMRERDSGGADRRGGADDFLQPAPQADE